MTNYEYFKNEELLQLIRTYVSNNYSLLELHVKLIIIFKNNQEDVPMTTIVDAVVEFVATVIIPRLDRKDDYVRILELLTKNSIYMKRSELYYILLTNYRNHMTEQEYFQTMFGCMMNLSEASIQEMFEYDIFKELIPFRKFLDRRVIFKQSA